MNNKESILILFDGPHLAFSPTTIQIYDELGKNHHVTIIAQDPEVLNGQKLNNRNVVYYKYYSVPTRHLYWLLFQVMILFNHEVKKIKASGLGHKDYFFTFLFIKRYLKRNKVDRIICIDIANLFFCQMLGKKVDFLSLEICKDLQLWSKINKDMINCVITQSIERYKFLFNDEQHIVFYIQNAPTFFEIEIGNNKKGLIYTGGANNRFGFFHCLDYLKKYSDESLTLQGVILKEDQNRLETEYSNLLNNGQLVINSDYIENDEMTDFLSKFEIGFCFYNFEDNYIKRNAFNYMSAPSGKMFKYLAAGVPVVCSDIIGFKFVNEFKCGVLVPNLCEDEIRKAVLLIRGDYNHYVKNSIAAAKYFSFDNSISHYLEFINSN